MTNYRRESTLRMIQKKWFRSIMMTCLMVMSFFVSEAQLVNVPVTGFNNDLIANGVGTGVAGSMPGVTYPGILNDGNTPTAYGFIDATYKWSAAGVLSTCFMPTNLLVPSALTPGLTYTLQSYTGNNSMTLDNNNTTYTTSPFPNSGTFTLTTPANYSKVYVLFSSVINLSTLTVDGTVTFTDATSQTFTGNNCVNWFTNTNVAFSNISRGNNTGTGTQACGAGAAPYLFEMNFALSGANYGKQVASVTLTIPTVFSSGTTAASVNYFHALAVGGMLPCVTPGSQPTAPSLTAISTSQINGSFTAAAGTPTGYLVVRYPAGGTETQPVNGTSYITGQSIGAGTIVQAAAGTTFNSTGLSGGTAYDYYVYSYNTGATCGGPVYLTTGGFIGTQTTTACGTMSGTIPIGATQLNDITGFTSITNALAFINTNGLGGNTILELQTDYNVAGETYPIIFPLNPCVSISKTLTIRPAAAVAAPFIFTSASFTNATLASATFIFDGASYITIDGRNGGTGSNKFIRIINTSSTAASAGNAVLMRNDANNNTLTYVDLQASNLNPAGNSGTITAGAVPGVVSVLSTTGLNGNDNNTISFCDIHSATSSGNMLNVGVYAYNATTVGNLSNNDNNTITSCNIYDLFHATTATAAIDILTGNSTWTISNNSVYQTASRTYTTAATHRGFWITPGSSAVGLSGYVITGNYIGGSAANCGGTAYTMLGTIATVWQGMDVSVGTLSSTNIYNNTIQNIALTTTSTGNPYFAGISVAGGNVNVGLGAGTGNTIGSGTGTGSITINNSTTSSTASFAWGIRFGGGAVINANYNTVGSITINNGGISNSFVAIGTNGGGTTSASFNNNLVGSLSTANSIQTTGAGVAGTGMGMCGIYVLSGPVTSTVNNNTIANLNSSYTGTTVGTVFGLRGIDVVVGANTVNNNVIRNLTTASTAGGTANSTPICALVMRSTTASSTVSGNQIYTLKLTTTSTTTATQITGIYWGPASSGTNLLSKNFIHSFDVAYTTTTSTAATFTGIDVAAGISNIQNNIIRLGINDAGASVTTPLVMRGISLSPTTAINIYYNTIYIGGTGVTSTTAANHTAAFNRGATSGTLVLRNNIFANLRTNAAAGQTNKNYSMRMGTATTGADFNYNDYYYNSGNDNAFALNNATVVAAYTAGWIASDANSQTGNPQFLLPNDPAATVDLHLNTAVGGVAESAGIALAGINDDYDGNIRQGSGGYAGSGTAPDMGADEYNGISAIPVINSLSITPSTTQCTAVLHTVTTSVTAAIGSTVSNITINYNVNGIAQVGIPMTLVSGTANTTSVWTGDIPVPTPANAAITWSVTATDGTFSKTQAGASYSDAPLFGAVATAVASVNPTCSGTPTSLSVVVTKPGVAATIGTGTSLTSATAQPTAFCNRWPSYRMQTIYTAAELQTAGLAAGNITAMAFNITTLGDGATNPGFTVNIGNTALSAFTAFEATGSFTNVYPAQTYTHTASGLQTINFTTPFFWNGTSNINVEVIMNGANATNNSVTVYTPTATNMVAYTATASNNTASLSTNRLNIIFTGTGAITPTAYSWSDGSTTVGTTNPLSVSPTISTTYTCTATALGCPITSNSVAITTNALPSAPTAGAPSTQCGTGIPTVDVTSTSGAGSPVFKWYDAPSGGNLLQTSTSTTYTSNISTTTTFYVTEVAGGICESSPRTAVVANVNSPDALTAAASALTNVCANTSINLSVTQTGSTNAYTLTWTATGGAASGITGSLSGGPQTITPTAAGTYIYTVTGVDGSCVTTSDVSVSVINPLAGVSAIATASINPVCSGTPTNLSVALSTGNLPAAPAASSYCASTHSSGCSGDNISRVVLNTLDKTTGTTCGSTSAAYSNFSGLTGANTTTLTAGTTYSIALTFGTDGNQYFGVWIDYNHNGAYSTTEFLGASGNAGASGTTSISFTPSASVAYNGITRMRIVGGNDSPVTSGQACGVSSSNFGETQDYDVTITGGLANVPFGGAITAVNWSDGFSSVGTTNPLSVSPTSATSYSCVVTSGGCTVTSNTLVVNVTTIPTAPTATSNSQCGYGIPTSFVTSTSGAGTPNFNWYSASTGGTLLQTGTFTTFQTAINSTQTYYVTEISGICESSPRTMVVATVTPADPISVVSSASTCIGTANPFSVSQTGSNQTYTTYSWYANPVSGSGVSGTPTGDTQTFTPTAVGTYNYWVIASDGNCTVIDTQSVKVYVGLTGSVSATQILSCVYPTGLITTNVSGAGTVVNNDFSSSTLPSYMTISGSASISGGQLIVTPTASGQTGAVMIQNTTGLANDDFQIDFDFITQGPAGVPFGPTAADGLSYSYGDDVSTTFNNVGNAITTIGYPSGTAVGNVAEGGSGTKLKISFDPWNNGSGTLSGNNGGQNYAGIYFMYNCTDYFNATHDPNGVTAADNARGVLAFSPATWWRATSTQPANPVNTTHVTIVMTGAEPGYPNGSTTLTLTGTTGLAQGSVFGPVKVALPAGYLAADKSTWKHVFAARTGGNWQGHMIDNLSIRYNNFYEYSIDNGASWTQTTPIVPPTSGTYPVLARYESVPGCFANIGTAVINAPSFTTTTTASTICAYSPTQPTLSFSPVFGAGAAYQWQSSPAGMNTWTDIIGETGLTYTPAPGSVTSNTDFHCVVSCAGTPIPGSPTSTITITPTTPTVLTSPGVSRCGPGTVVLNGTASVGATLNWYTAATGGTATPGSSYTTPIVTTSGTNFYVSAIDGTCESPRTAVPVTLTTSPSITATSGATTVCAGNPTTVSVSSSNDPDYTYSWTSNPAGFTASGNGPHNITVASTTTYTVYGIDNTSGPNAGCGALSAVTVNATTNNIALSAISTPATVCSGQDAQLNATATFPTSVGGYSFSASSGTFTPLVGGTVLTLASGSTDDGYFGAITIPFSFNYAGVSYTQFTPSTNGILTMGTSSSTSTLNSLTSNTPRPFIAPLSDDMDAISATVSYTVTGSVGSRVLTVEWLNMEWYYNISTGSSISYQCKLYETTGKIEFIYQQEAGALEGSEGASIGLAGSATGSYLSLSGSDAAPTASSSTETTTINAKPATGQVYTFLPPPPSGGFTYDWSLNSSNLSATNISNPIAQVVTSPQTYTVVVTDAGSGCTKSTTVNLAVNAIPDLSTSGGGVACEGNGISLSVSNNAPGQVSGNTYAWTTDAAIPFTSTQQTPNVTGSSVAGHSGNYTVVVTNSFLCTSSAIEVVTVNPNPTLSIVSTQNVGCAGGSDGSITVGATGGLANYDFTSDFVNFINDPAQGTITNLPTGSTTIFVSDANGCNSQISASLTAISTVPPSAAVVVPFIGMPTNVCNGTTATLSIPAVSNTTMYIWDAPGAAYFNGNPLNVSPFTTSTPSVTVTYSTPGGSLYVTGVQAANGCGASLRKVQKTRGTISVPAIVSGSTTACANTTGTYSTGAVDAASSYQWTITGDATVSGTGTTATVTFGPAWNGGTLCVAAQTSCYTSPAKCITLSKSASTLNAISGAFTACPNTTLSYSVPPSTGAASYTWTLPAGSTGSSTTNSISVTYGPGYSAAGSICVSVTSVCGVTSAIKCKTVAPGLPGQPSSITGALAGLCNQTVAYSCPSQGAGVTYNWTSPGSITSGQGSTSISTTFAALSTGNVCVTASNSCGSSLARCVPVKGAPNAPGAITATPSSWCANTPGIEFNVSTGSLTGSYTLSWAYPNASVVTYAFGGGNSTSLILDWISGSGAVNVTASNACGGATKPSTWSSTCREGETGTVSSMTVSPNPTTGVVNVNYTATKGSTVINVLDLAGRVVMTQATSSVEGVNTTQLDMSKLAKGAYMLSVQSTQGNKQIKVVVE